MRVSVVDNGISNMLKRLYDVERVPDVSSSYEEISQDDLKFLQIMEDGIKKVDGHYELPLPLSDSNAALPCNLPMAERHLLPIVFRLLINFRIIVDGFMFLQT